MVWQTSIICFHAKDTGWKNDLFMLLTSIAYFYIMNYSMIINILEVVLLAAFFIFIVRFIFMNYTPKVRKPAAWVHAAKEGLLSAQLRRAEKNYPDRIRFYNIWLQISRIERQGIKGDFAELGVYKGETARIIHLCSPERKLHLFDTFKGFPAGDLKEETGKAASYTTKHFADTRPEKVKQLLGEHRGIICYPGYFPHTAKGLEQEKFAFVSIDADLYKPTKAGLEFFYPKLPGGGIILVHDYNNEWPGVMKAVDEFCNTIHEPAIPVPDADSTVMIMKNG